MILARRGLLAGLAGLLSGCSPATLLNATVSRQGFTRDADIAYGSDPRQKLDLYRPDKPRSGRQDGDLLLRRLVGFGAARTTTSSSARRWPPTAIPSSFPTTASIPLCASCLHRRRRAGGALDRRPRRDRQGSSSWATRPAPISP
jgi:hypothetical protein